MTQKINPFHDLYVTESFGPEAFVKLFSNALVDHTLALFKPGNVILKGLPGTGKSMMLNLLKPSVRIAYKRCGKDFPIPVRFSKFIGAGINLITSSVSDFGHRPLIEGKEYNLNELAIYFGDFLNYWLVKDIINSLIELNEDLGEELNINLTAGKLDEFANKLAKDNAWFGYLDGVESFNELNERIKNRIILYRSYLNYNIDKLPENIAATKTSIGTPINVTANYLRECGIIDSDMNIFVKIDQYEELSWLDDSVEGLGAKYKSVVNKLLAMRDDSVSYRIGTRPFAWSDEPQNILGTNAKLEALRNYNSVSIDEVLKRQEHSKTYRFPSFAEDIFTRRLKENGYNLKLGSKSLLREVFGKGLDPIDKALKYVSNNSKERAIEIEPSWPEPWKIFLRELAQKDPFSARLGEAWARQRGKESITHETTFEKPYPWEKKKYWKKERVEQALVQIASRNRQQLYWEGKDDIIQLSGGNILAFLSLCQQIWEVWMRDTKSNASDNSIPQLDYVIQTLGILEASVKWFASITERKGGNDRKHFITYIGTKFYRALIEDSRMSYPGHIGFSLELSDLERSDAIYKFLKEASDFGDIQERPHTTKSRSGEKRIKWYLNPILSPFFKIPVNHTKEPLYIDIYELKSWLSEAKVDVEGVPNNVKIKKKNKLHKEISNQGNLFNDYE